MCGLARPSCHHRDDHFRYGCNKEDKTCASRNRAMKRIYRKKLIEELEYLRQGFRSAYDFVAKTKCHKMSMGAFHFFTNGLVSKYGGERVEDVGEKAGRNSQWGQ